MSQHCFITYYRQRPIKVIMGWDRPLQGYFLVIEYLDSDDDYLWSNLDHKDSHPKTLESFLKVLADFRIDIPNEMLREVENDGLNNVGNKEVSHI